MCCLHRLEKCTSVRGLKMVWSLGIQHKEGGFSYLVSTLMMEIEFSLWGLKYLELAPKVLPVFDLVDSTLALFELQHFTKFRLSTPV